MRGFCAFRREGARLLRVKRRPELTAEQDQLILGRALRALRNEAGITQEQLAERLQVDPTFVGVWSGGSVGLTGARFGGYSAR
jgi:DNA-binding transcriptional regulator YiaG